MMAMVADAGEGAGPVDAAAVEQHTQALGRALFRRVQQYRPSLTEAAGDRAMAVLAADVRFRARLLRFIDALAGLDGDRGGVRVRRLLQEYLDADFSRLPRWLRLLLPVARSDLWPPRLVAGTARRVARTVASRFIASGGGAGVRRTLAYLDRQGRYPSFDVLGEYVASEREADAYRDQYLELLRLLARAPEAGQRTPGGQFQLQVSVKLSSLTADFNPVDPEGTLARVRPRLGAIVERARRHGIGVTLDMERFETRDLTQAIFFDVFAAGRRFGDWDGIGVVLQAYLRDAEDQAEALIRFARERGTPFGVRLVKGAYWDYETVVARANGWPSPVWEEKVATDLTFERLTALLLDVYPAVRPAVASHNLRSHAQAEALRQAYGLPPGSVEHQTLFRTAEGITRSLSAMGWPVRDYVPLGDLIPGMAYLVRRILENSSQVGFLLQSRSGESAATLLAPPRREQGKAGGTIDRAPTDGWTRSDGNEGTSGVGAHVTAPAADSATTAPSAAAALSAFRNNPPKRLFLAEEREAFAAALAGVQEEFGREYLLRLSGEDVRTGWTDVVRDPSHHERPVLGVVHTAGEAEVRRALELARSAAAGWAARTIGERAGILRRAGDLLAGRRDETAAWMVHEAAKSWPEALADVDEAIDYLRYYALLAESLAGTWSGNGVTTSAVTPRAGATPSAYGARGVAAVIPPWNFPIAIPCGMTAAALVTGNAVILKPAEQTPLTAWRLVRVLHEAGVPEDALIWLPGPGESVGAALVASPLVDMVAFTGSRGVGTRIYEEGSRVRPARGGLRATVAEMGGKNAIVVLPDADLDEAVVGILRSAFGHANQKCSAASRVLIHRDIYPRLRPRLVEGARSLPTGPADAPGTLITPLIDGEARERVLRAGAEAREEGRVLLDELQRPGGVPNTVGEESRPPTLLGPELVEIPADEAGSARTAQEEIFGPVLALIPFADEAEAVRIANGTRYALTGGLFSRSPGAVERMARELDAGNLYVNRPTTGARVGVEPFGGHRMSGTGPKAGGEEYLWAFVTSAAGYRQGQAGLPSGGRAPDPGVPRPWRAGAHARAAAVRRALQRLRAAGAIEAAALAVGEALLRQIDELAEPEPTTPLPGQQTETRWDTPRGCGIILVDAAAPAVSLTALVLGALLAGNGVLVAPDGGRRPEAEGLVRALHQEGAGRESVVLAPDGLDLAASVALPEVTFAAVDAPLAATAALYQMLGDASAAPGASCLKALITLADGPPPDTAGFLRRFALPKTVAVQTLHLGAELELLASAGE